MPDRDVCTDNVLSLATGGAFKFRVVPPPLSVGIFFDGTGNNKDNTEKQPSNIAKLWSVYKDESGTDCRSIYIRGIGTDHAEGKDRKQLDNDLFWGKAWGYGAEKRTAYALEHLKAIYAEYIDTHGSAPHTVLLDVFGFSRGAFLARNFVNLVRRDDLDEELYPLPSVRFLGLFDTVEAVGLSGDDRHYRLHVDASNATYIYQLVAEDELRAKFPLQSLRREPAAEIPDRIPEAAESWVVERLCPGVHSDVGGGYQEQDDGADPEWPGGDDLSRVYLGWMHEAASGCGVPFEDLSGADDHDPQKVLAAHDKVEATYEKYPGLRERHMVFRCHVRQMEVLAEQLGDFEDAVEALSRNPGAGWGDLGVENFASETQKLREQLGAIEEHRIQPMVAMLDRFMGGARKFQTFHDGDYRDLRKQGIHRSHRPYNTTPFMMAEDHDVDGQAWPMKKLDAQQQAAFRDAGVDPFGRATIYPDPFHQAAIPDHSHSMLVTVQVVVANAQGGEVRHLGEGFMVDLVRSIIGFPKLQGGGETDENGVARFFCFNRSEAPNLYFRVSGIKGEYPVGSTRIRFPGVWESKHNDCLNDARYRGDHTADFYPGYLKSYTKDSIGSLEKPLILFLREHGSGSDASAPPIPKI